MNQVYLVGKVSKVALAGSIGQFAFRPVGVFSSTATADAACVDGSYFYAPVTIDSASTVEAIELSAVFPRGHVATAA